MAETTECDRGQQVTYRHEFLPTSLMKLLNQQRLAGQYCDVTIRVQDGSFHLHRCVLAAFSSYIAQMDSSSSHHTPVIELPALTCRGMRPVVSLLYTSKLQLDDKNVFEVYTAAGYLHLQDVIADCVDFLKRRKPQTSRSEGQGDVLEATSTSRSDDGAETPRPVSVVPASPHPSRVASAGPSEAESVSSIVKIEDSQSPTSCEFVGFGQGQDHTIPGNVGMPLPSAKRNTTEVMTADTEHLVREPNTSDEQQFTVHRQAFSRPKSPDTGSGGNTNTEEPYQYIVVNPEGPNRQITAANDDITASTDAYFVADNSVEREPSTFNSTGLYPASNPAYQYLYEPGLGSSSTGQGNSMTAERKRSDCVCLVCGRIFSRNSRLKVHMRTHTGEKPFHCQLCPAKFSVKCNLKAHVASLHLREKPYKCSQCPANFAQQRRLAKHMTDYHT